MYTRGVSTLGGRVTGSAGLVGEVAGSRSELEGWAD